MEMENGRAQEADPQSCQICKENLKKYSTLPIVGLALLLLTNTALTVTRHRGGSTSFNLCHNYTLPSLPDFQHQKEVDSKVEILGNSSHCLPKHSLHLGKDIYLNVCDYRGSVRVDIRRFVPEEEGIRSTIRGIYLSPDQWESLERNANFVNVALKEISSHGP